MTHKTDVAIIGAGPAGLFAIFECGMHKLSCHVIDALPEVGGQCTALYPEKPIYDIPAYPSILAGQLVRELEAQAAPFNPVFHLNQQVITIQKDGDHWFLETSTGTKIEARAIIIAAGVGAFGPKRPPLDNIEQYEENHVFYYVKNKEKFRGKKIVIAGGGDSAVDWALSLHDIAEKVMFVHRRPKFRAAADSVEKLEALASQGKIEMVVPYQLHALKGDRGTLKEVVVKSMDGAEKALEADVLLPFFGLSMNLGPIAEWGLNLDRQHITVPQGTCETSTPSIFAIGDIATYPHKLKLILTGFADAAHAAHKIREIVYPDQVFHFEYSTTQGAPGE